MTVSSKIIIGDVVNPPVLFDKYELWIQFDTGDCVTEIMFPDQALDRLNAWERIMPLTGPEQAEAVKYDFSWPCYDNCHVPAPVVKLTMFYYDVAGDKRHTELK